MGIARGWEKRVLNSNEKRTVRIFSVSPQSCSLFSASFQTFCWTARAYLNTQKYGLFCSRRGSSLTSKEKPRKERRRSERATAFTNGPVRLWRKGWFWRYSALRRTNISWCQTRRRNVSLSKWRHVHGTMEMEPQTRAWCFDAYKRRSVSLFHVHYFLITSFILSMNK